MIRKIRKIIPHEAVNYGKHLPMAVMANLKYGFPSRQLKVIGITGTDGKTTTTNMLYKILSDAGKKSSMISTINAFISGKSYDTGFHVTSPDSHSVQRYIQMAKRSGDEVMILEVTSHALEQFRFWGVEFDFGIVTNITHEHLDYHGSFDNYVKAKAKLVQNARYAVLNIDDPSFTKLKSATSGKVITFGFSKEADFNPTTFPLKLKVPGDFNLLNAWAAAAVATELGVDRKVIVKSLESFTGLNGRLEEIKNSRGIKIVVDFAHTPNGLEQALKALRGLTKGRLISVFGSASERDITKRPLMGEISSRLADVTVLTDEDPRFENSLKIINEIAQGAYQNGAKDEVTLFKEPNRAKAIKLAIKMAKRGDTVGIFGKGHEQSMNYKGVEKPWSDQRSVLQALKQLDKVKINRNGR